MDEIAGLMKSRGRDEPFMLPKSSYVSLIKDFDKKLDSIQEQLSHMKLILFEMSDGKYNPFTDDSRHPMTNIDSKLDEDGKISERAEAAAAELVKETEQHAEAFQNNLHAFDQKLDETEKELSEIEKSLQSSVVSLAEGKGQDFEAKKSEFDNFLIRLGDKVKDAVRFNKGTHSAPEGQEFHFSNGSVASSLPELYSFIKNCEDSVFYSHVSEDRNDFASWVENVLDNQSLAESLRSASSREDTLTVLSNHLS